MKYVLSALAIASVVGLGTSKAEAAGVGDLAGPWQATLLWSNSGCGPISGLLNFTLNKDGVASSATLASHTNGCGDSTTKQAFTIESLDSEGSGTANLTCGVGCGWNFVIQVSNNNKIFNLVDVDPANPGNFVEGLAISQSP
jgi:hypothetical protein